MWCRQQIIDWLCTCARSVLSRSSLKIGVRQSNALQNIRADSDVADRRFGRCVPGGCISGPGSSGLANCCFRVTWQRPPGRTPRSLASRAAHRSRSMTRKQEDQDAYRLVPRPLPRTSTGRHRIGVHSPRVLGTRWADRTEQPCVASARSRRALAVAPHRAAVARAEAKKQQRRR